MKKPFPNNIEGRFYPVAQLVSPGGADAFVCIMLDGDACAGVFWWNEKFKLVSVCRASFQGGYKLVQRYSVVAPSVVFDYASGLWAGGMSHGNAALEAIGQFYAGRLLLPAEVVPVLAGFLTEAWLLRNRTAVQAYLDTVPRGEFSRQQYVEQRQLLEKVVEEWLQYAHP